MKTITLTEIRAYINQSLHNQEGHNTLVDPYTLVVVYNKVQHLELTLPVYPLQSPHPDMALYAVSSLPSHNP